MSKEYKLPGMSYEESEKILDDYADLVAREFGGMTSRDFKEVGETMIREMRKQMEEQEMKYEPKIEVRCPVCDKTETFPDVEGAVGVRAWQCDCGLEITLSEDDNGYTMHIQQVQKFDRPKKEGKKMGINGLIDSIERWAIDKGLDEADPIKQLAKLMEEVGELAEGLVKGYHDQVADSIGDSVVVLTILAMQMGFDIQDCIQVAYDEIKGRTGKMVDGVFVKSEDLED